MRTVPKHYGLQTDRQTDGRTDGSLTIAIQRALRGKNARILPAAKIFRMDSTSAKIRFMAIFPGVLWEGGVKQCFSLAIIHFYTD